MKTDMEKGTYDKGLKDYLASFEVGECRRLDTRFKVGSIRSSSYNLARTYGCKFSIKNINGVYVIRRLV